MTAAATLFPDEVTSSGSQTDGVNMSRRLHSTLTEQKGPAVLGRLVQIRSCEAESLNILPLIRLLISRASGLGCGGTGPEAFPGALEQDEAAHPPQKLKTVTELGT